MAVATMNLLTNFQDLVAKVKNLGALAPVLGTISRLNLCHIKEIFVGILLLFTDHPIVNILLLSPLCFS